MTPRTSAGRFVAVRLSDVPLKIRRRYGDILVTKVAREGDPLGAAVFAAQMHRAVESPSERVYWLPETAVRKVLS